MNGLVIRFDGPPAPESGRFVEVELDGKSISLGTWQKDGGYWVLLMPPAVEQAARESVGGYRCSTCGVWFKNDEAYLSAGCVGGNSHCE